MTVNSTKMFKELEPFLGKYGIRVKSWEMSSRHRKVWVTDGVKKALIYVSVSPSDFRAYQNIAKSARNAIREAR
jgi:hypothetical protein